MCHPRTRGRPSKERALSDPEPSSDRLNPERVAWARHEYAADIEVTPVVED